MAPRPKNPPKQSAGLLLHRTKDGTLEVLLAHPGGPFWAKKDVGAWTIPKGEIEPGEEALQAAIREVEEEIGSRLDGPFVSLSPVRQKSGKVVHAWAVEAELDVATVRSNVIAIEWPPGSGQRIDIPEIDRAAWCDLPTARAKINPGQVPLLDELERLLAGHA